MIRQERRFDNDMLPVKNQAGLFATGWIGFQFIAMFFQIFVFLLNEIFHWSSSILDELGVSMLINSLSYVTLFVLLILISNRYILRLLPSFKRYESYIAGVLCFLAILAFSTLYGYIVSLLQIKIDSNANQTSIDSVQSVFPFTSLIIFGLIGPICEELTYRVGLFSFFKRKSRLVAYVVTIIIFTLIHFNFSRDSVKLFNELLNIPFYVFAALAFTFVYDKYGFAASLTAHVINNIMSFVFVAMIH